MRPASKFRLHRLHSRCVILVWVMNRILYIIGGLCMLALPACAGENIVLQSGFRLAADHHEVDGATIRIFSGDGVTEMPVSLVASVEVDESVPVEPVAAPQPVAAPVPAKPEPVNLTP